MAPRGQWQDAAVLSQSCQAKVNFTASDESRNTQPCCTGEPRGKYSFGAYQSPVLQVLSQEAVVIQGIFGFPCHPVDWPFVHLVLDSSEQHVERLPDGILAQKGRSVT